MIADALIGLPYVILSWFISLLPTSQGFPQELWDAVEGIGGYVSMFSVIMPLEALAATLTIVLAVELGIFGFKTFKWITSHIPFLGGKGN